MRLYWIECRTEYATISDIVGFGCVLFVIYVEQIPYYWFSDKCRANTSTVLLVHNV